MFDIDFIYWEAFTTVVVVAVVFFFSPLPLSVMTACYSPSVRPLSHCQITPCSRGKPRRRAEYKQNEQ